MSLSLSRVKVFRCHQEEKIRRFIAYFMSWCKMEVRAIANYIFREHLSHFVSSGGCEHNRDTRHFRPIPPSRAPSSHDSLIFTRHLPHFFEGERCVHCIHRRPRTELHQTGVRLPLLRKPYVDWKRWFSCTYAHILRPFNSIGILLHFIAFGCAPPSLAASEANFSQNWFASMATGAFACIIRAAPH